MHKTILITGSTDGIGLETARRLHSMGHFILLHGRNRSKLEKVRRSLSGKGKRGQVEAYVADLSKLDEVDALAKAIAEQHDSIDVLINNAGIFSTPEPITPDGLDVRFVVNVLAPYRLTHRLLPLLGESGRVVNLSSAAQSPVDLEAMAGTVTLTDDFQAYAQSKLALTMWSRQLGLSFGNEGPMIVSVNPGSLLATKMVKEGFGMAGSDVSIGVDILVRAALADEFDKVSGQYFDNDTGRFTSPHPDALDPQKTEAVVRSIEKITGK